MAAFDSSDRFLGRVLCQAGVRPKLTSTGFYAIAKEEWQRRALALCRLTLVRLWFVDSACIEGATNDAKSCSRVFIFELIKLVGFC